MRVDLLLQGDKMKPKIYQNVTIGNEAVIEEGVIIGRPPHGKKDGELPTVIGDHAVIRAHTIICAGVTIGDHFQTGPSVFIRESNTFGDHVCAWANAVLNPGNIIGNDVRIHVACFMEQTTIGNHVFIGPRVTFSDDPHPVMPPDFEECWGGAVVEDHVIIGAGSTFLPHVRIGAGAFIGAGSVVTKDVPAGVVAFGNPAKVHKSVEDIFCNRRTKIHYPYKKEGL